MNKQNIFLVGPMGAGKTTVGRMLSRELGYEYYDSDDEIEKRTGVEVAWIFDIEGEDGFRQRERDVIDELTQLKQAVVATGGGVVLHADNRRHLSARGLVIYLHVSVEQQLARLEKDRRRPLLQTDDRREKLITLHQERDTLYQEIADYTFDTDTLSVRTVTSQVIQKLK